MRSSASRTVHEQQSIKLGKDARVLAVRNVQPWHKLPVMHLIDSSNDWLRSACSRSSRTDSDEESGLSVLTTPHMCICGKDVAHFGNLVVQVIGYPLESLADADKLVIQRNGFRKSER